MIVKLRGHKPHYSATNLGVADWLSLSSHFLRIDAFDQDQMMLPGHNAIF